MFFVASVVSVVNFFSVVNVISVVNVASEYPRESILFMIHRIKLNQTSVLVSNVWLISVLSCLFTGHTDSLDRLQCQIQKPDKQSCAVEGLQTAPSPHSSPMKILLTCSSVIHCKYGPSGIFSRRPSVDVQRTGDINPGNINPGNTNRNILA